MMAKDNQKPPNDERAVAPKVLPAAISLNISPARIISFMWLCTTVWVGEGEGEGEGGEEEEEEGEEEIQHSPHAGKQLHQSTVAKSNSDHNVGLGETPCAHVDQSQNKGGQGEGGEPQGSGIGKFSVGDLFVETGLEFSSKGWQTIVAAAAAAAAVGMGKRPIAEASGGFGGLVFFG